MARTGACLTRSPHGSDRRWHDVELSRPSVSRWNGPTYASRRAGAKLMEHARPWQVRLGSLLGAGGLLSIACGDVDGPPREEATTSVEDVRTTTDALRDRHWRRRPPVSVSGSGSGTGGSSSSSTTGGTASAGSAPIDTAGASSTSGAASGERAECSLCTVTQDCCNAVNAGALCTFSADTCASLDAPRQASYALYCLTVLRTTISTWTMNRRIPPPVCSLPH
jgi:hypothetical protein